MSYRRGSCGLLASLTLFAGSTLVQADTSFIRTWVEANGGCKATLFPPVHTTPRPGEKYLGKSAENWTDEDIEEFRRVFLKCMLIVNSPPGTVNLDTRLPPGFTYPVGERSADHRAQLLARNFIAPARAAKQQREAQAEAQSQQAATEARAAEERAQQAERDKQAFDAAQPERDRLREQIAERAHRDQELAGEITGQAEAEERKLAEVKQVAEEARRAREAAEAKLAEAQAAVEQARRDPSPPNVSPPAAPQLSRSDALSNVSVRNVRWRRDGFDVTMTASFTIQNTNTFPIKDVEVTCRHFANSGTQIDSNTRTVYERVSAGGSFSVRNFNMGFIHSQVKRTECSVTDFGRT
jgi:hypothetical protein